MATEPQHDHPTEPSTADPPSGEARGAHGGGGNTAGKHAGHHTEAFRRRFWWSLLLTIPVVATSHMVMEWFGYELDFPGIERFGS